MKHTLISLFSIFTFIPLNASDAVQAPKLAAGMTLTICQHDSVQLEKLLIQSDSELTNLRIKRNNLAQYTYSPEGNRATLSYTHIVKNGHSLTTTLTYTWINSNTARIDKLYVSRRFYNTDDSWELRGFKIENATLYFSSANGGTISGAETIEIDGGNALVGGGWTSFTIHK